LRVNEEEGLVVIIFMVHYQEMRILPPFSCIADDQDSSAEELGTDILWRIILLEIPELPQ
jgi:hypothetical protein